MNNEAKGAGRAFLKSCADISAAGCGFLLARGLAGGARCAGWEMPALTGAATGSMWAAVLFGLACAVSCLAHVGFGAGASAVSGILTAALYTMHMLLCAPPASPVLVWLDGAAVLAALLSVRAQKTGPAETAVLALLLVPARFCVLPEADPLLALRLSALTGATASAGLCGSAIAGLSVRDAGKMIPGLTAGAALGLL